MQNNSGIFAFLRKFSSSNECKVQMTVPFNGSVSAKIQCPSNAPAARQITGKGRKTRSGKLYNAAHCGLRVKSTRTSKARSVHNGACAKSSRPTLLRKERAMPHGAIYPSVEG